MSPENNEIFLDRREFLRKMGMGTALAGMVIYLPGCQSDTSSDAGTTLAGTATTLAGTGTTLAESFDPLQIAVPGGPEGLDPAFASAAPTFTVLRHTHSGLLSFPREPLPTYPGFEQRNRTMVEPMMAEEFEVAEGGRVLNFRIRDDLSFPSGNPFTMDDVSYIFERGFAVEGISAFLLSVATIDSMDQLTIVDDHSFTIELPAVNPLAPLIFPMPAMSVMDSRLLREQATDEDPWAQEWVKRNATGYGPLVLQSLVPDQELTMSPFEGYRHEPAQRFPLEFQIVPSEGTRVILSQEGSVDAAVAIPYRQIPQLEEQGLRSLSLLADQMTSIIMNVNSEPFSDVRVRRALAHAIPYDRIVDEALHGFGRKGLGPVSQDIPGHSTEAWSQFGYEYDTDASRVLLADAGYEDGFATELFYPDDLGFYESAAGLIKESFADVGVDVTLQQLTLAVYFERLAARELPLGMSTGWPWFADTGYNLNLNHYSTSPGNWEGYTNEEVDRLIDEGMYAPEPERTQRLAQAQELIIQDCPRVWLVQPNKTLVFQSDVEGYVYTAEDSDEFYFMRRRT